MKVTFLLLVLMLSFLTLGSKTHGKETCVSKNGLMVCVEMKGSYNLYHIMHSKNTDLAMDIFHISIANRSTRTVLICPQNFRAITTEGYPVTVDAPLYDGIEWSSKLRRTHLPPGQTLEGHLFFPSLFGHIRRLIHRGNPFFEVNLF